MSVKQEGQSGFKGFFNGRECEVYASSAYEAKQKATAIFKPSKKQAHMVHVIVCERLDGSPVVHSTAGI